jgi:hypothetical protein
MSALPTETELTTLAASINADHRRVREALGHALKSAMDAGDKLRLAKSQLGHGEWMPWLEANCDVSGRTARLYTGSDRWRKEPWVSDIFEWSREGMYGGWRVQQWLALPDKFVEVGGNSDDPNNGT